MRRSTRRSGAAGASSSTRTTARCFLSGVDLPCTQRADVRRATARAVKTLTWASERLGRRHADLRPGSAIGQHHDPTSRAIVEVLAR
jgi:hypothetical protein